MARDIETERLKVIENDPAHIDHIMALMSFWEVAKNTGTWIYPPDRDQVIERMQKLKADKGIAGCVFAGNEFIGTAGLKEATLWYLLHPDHWAKGYASEVAKALIAYGFQRYGWDMIYAGVWDDNPASLSVLAKCGMKQIGTVRYWSRARSAPVTSCEHVLTRSEWLLNNSIRIDTPRVVLRGLNADHVTDIARIGGDQKVAPMIMHATVPWPVHDAAAWIEASAYNGQLGYRLGIFKTDGPLMGCIGIGPDKSLMYFLDPSYWGQGYATEAVRAFLKDCYGRFDLEEVIADHFHDNPASGRVLRKVGFEYTGQALGQSAAREKKEEVCEYSLSRVVLRAL